MATIMVEGVPDALVARLAIVAAKNGRCLNSELIVHLARSAELSAHPGVADLGARSGTCGGAGGRPCRCAGRRSGAAPAVGWGGPADTQPVRGAGALGAGECR
jgi:hypothetical protein